MVQDQILSREEKKEYWEVYLKYRRAGKGIEDAFRLTNMEFEAEGGRVPSFGSARTWIAKGVPECPEIDMGKVRGIENKPDKTSVEEVPENMPDKPDMTDNLDAAEDAELLKLLTKAYRLRSEKTIDDLVDHLLPELFEEA